MRAQRHQKIMEIVDRRPVETQEELANELIRAGYRVTQATVSRDIKKLGLIKVATEDNRYRYAVPGEGFLVANQTKTKRVFRDSIISLDFSGNIIVVKTTPGAAQAVAQVIDTEKWKEIIGTVAGDDTILVVVKPKSAAQQVVRKFKSFLA